MENAGPAESYNFSGTRHENMIQILFPTIKQLFCARFNNTRDLQSTPLLIVACNAPI